MQKLNDNGIELNRTIVIVVSCLVNYFTAYIADSYKFLNNEVGKQNNVPPMFDIYYNRSSGKKIYIESVEYLISLIEHQFPSYKFIYHKDIFLLKVSGSGKYGGMQLYAEGDSHSFYDYLFDNNVTSIPHVLD